MAFIPPEIVAQVKAQANIYEVVSEFIDLKRSGPTRYVGLSPKGEKTPSFTVFEQTNTYKDFSAGGSGDSISFLMTYQNMNFEMAINFLCKKYGIVIPVTLSPAEKLKLAYQAKIIQANEFATAYYEKILWSEAGKEARSYLSFRGYSEELIKEFRIGFSNDYEGLVKAFRESGKFDMYFLCDEAEILHRKQHGWFDKFHHRLIFPVSDSNGKIIAFNGRILNHVKGSGVPKYVNSRDTQVFKKKKTLYGLAKAKQAIIQAGFVYIVEGPTDVATLWDLNIRNVVASLGTAFSMEHLRQLKGVTKNFVLLMDGDKAGKKASDSMIDILLTANGVVKIVSLPDNHDPDSYKREFGADKLVEYLKENAEDYIYRKARESLFKHSHDRAKAISTLMRTICYYTDQMIRYTYLQEISRISMIPLKILQEAEAKVILQKEEKRLSYEKRVSKDPSFYQEFKQTYGNQALEKSFVDGKLLKMTPEKELLRLMMRFSKQEVKVNDEDINFSEYIMNEIGNLELNFIEEEDNKLIFAIHTAIHEGRQPSLSVLIDNGYSDLLGPALMTKFTLSELQYQRYLKNSPTVELLNRAKILLLPASILRIRNKLRDLKDPEEIKKTSKTLDKLLEIREEWASYDNTGNTVTAKHSKSTLEGK